MSKKAFIILIITIILLLMMVMLIVSNGERERESSFLLFIFQEAYNFLTFFLILGLESGLIVNKRRTRA